MENIDFLVIRLKGSGLNPAFLLDIDLCYSYIQPNQKLGFIVIIAWYGSCRKAISFVLLLLKQTCHSEGSGIAFGRPRKVTI